MKPKKLNQRKFTIYRRFNRKFNDKLSFVEVAFPDQQKECNHEWRERVILEQSSGWRSVCRLCGKCRRSFSFCL